MVGPGELEGSEAKGRRGGTAAFISHQTTRRARMHKKSQRRRVGQQGTHDKFGKAWTTGQARRGWQRIYCCIAWRAAPDYLPQILRRPASRPPELRFL